LFQIKIDIASYQLDYLRFCSKFHRMCIKVLEYVAQKFTAIILIFYFWQNSKDV